MIEPSRRHRRNLDLSSLSTPKKIINSTIPENRIKEDLEEELSKIKSFRSPSLKPMAQSFFRIRRRPILKTQFSSIEETEEENDSDVFVYIRLVCLEDLSDCTFETSDVVFPINRVYRFGKPEKEDYLRFDSSSDSEAFATIKRANSASSTTNKIGLDCNFISKEHAELWYDENKQILCTGFPSVGSDLSLDEVRVDSGKNGEEILRRNSCATTNDNKEREDEEGSIERRIMIRSGDVVTPCFL
ncbi:unnamed protein product [Lepeophtheirus salmonis]|uniref:(salmon louse) hypothetical protein n=1 Tax=Lepeophtheirus salmonis TaxID=72036 RepID=A0A7R8CNB5_LEPSM|nr:unnamed protein product [Lepeophtheirus salmonis]CAF2873868.1 unnamed protein product [Lepeophtheirus salmonis]